MIEIKTPAEIDKMRKSGKILKSALDEVRNSIRPGIATLELDRICEDVIKANGGIPGFKGYSGFPNAACISVNDEIIHGIPGDRVIQDGDIVSVDSGVLLDGWFSDSAITVIAGSPKSDEDAKLVEVTEKALYVGIENALVGNRIGDIGNAIEKFVTGFGFSLVKEYTGHGIGRHLHEDPSVPNYGRKGLGAKISVGLCIAIEPMVCAGSADVFVEDNGWTVKTKDHSNAAHFEHTIAITDGGAVLLTA
ncbi:MAG: type I methionyl aminopeptidase [Caldisericaceae bacterium]